LGPVQPLWKGISHQRRLWPGFGAFKESQTAASRRMADTAHIPFVSLVLMILTLREAPKTANETRMWTLIGLVPTGLIALVFLGLLVSISF
jgi:hypothetical protein